MTEIFNLLTDRSGAYSLPWLIKLSNADASTIIYRAGNTEDVVYGGHTYVSTSLEYKPAAEVLGFDGGASLSIYCGKDDTIIDLIESNRTILLEVVGAINDDGTITAIRVFSHTTGAVDWDKTKATFTYEKDERLSMTFPAIVISAINARGLP